MQKETAIQIEVASGYSLIGRPNMKCLFLINKERQVKPYYKKFQARINSTTSLLPK